jgi:hypothetical protein
MEEFLIYLEENKDTAIEVFESYYKDTAISEGEIMLMDPAYCDNGDDIEPIDMYEQYAHLSGHLATYDGARGVIAELSGGFLDVDEDDEDLQWETLLILEKEPN